jgi:hypothetical protein
MASVSVNKYRALPQSRHAADVPLPPNRPTRGRSTNGLAPFADRLALLARRSAGRFHGLRSAGGAPPPRIFAHAVDRSGGGETAVAMPLYGETAIRDMDI